MLKLYAQVFLSVIKIDSLFYTAKYNMRDWFFSNYMHVSPSYFAFPYAHLTKDFDWRTWPIGNQKSLG